MNSEKNIIEDKSLKAIYHDCYGRYTDEYKRRFEHPHSYHFDFSIGENPAFFLLNKCCYETIINIWKIENEINKILNQLPPIAVEQYRTKSLIDEILLTNDIEGVNSTRKEIEDILSSLAKKNKRQRFYGIVNKYNKLMQDSEISLDNAEDVRAIYDEIILDEVKTVDFKNMPDGKIFRKDSVIVYSAAQKEIHKGVYPEDEIIFYMEKALEFLKDNDVDKLVRIAVFHYLFGYIHPFYDGNGRTSRFISSYLLSKELNSLLPYRISYTIKENISKYYNAFKVCNDPRNKGDITPFIEMFLEMIRISQINLCLSLIDKYKDWGIYTKKICSMDFCISDDMKRLCDVLIQATLFSNGGISTSELENFMGLTFKPLKERLQKIPSELLEIRRKGNKNYYRINVNKLVDG